jgi:hypothetical protein
MGEVYRADDLTLVIPVALKFLSSTFAKDPDRLGRFYNEVRKSDRERRAYRGPPVHHRLLFTR